MSNGTMQQLSSVGVQDGHLSISPETSFWKRSFKRVAGFAIEAVNQDLGTVTWNASNTQTRTQQISRNGDLLVDMYIVVDLGLLELNAPAGDTVRWTNVLGHAMFTDLQLQIGGTTIDQFDGNFMEILWELTSTTDINVDELVLRGSNTAQLIDWTNNGNAWDDAGNAVTRLYVKVPFYFSMAKSQALPVISLQYHDIRLKFTLRAKNNLMVFSNAGNTTLDGTNDGSISSMYIMNMFAFVDSLERRLFATNAHEYLIRNVQISNFHAFASTGNATLAQSATLLFNQPVLALAWFYLTDANETALDYFNWELTPGQGDDPLISAQLEFNGAVREGPRDALFWRVVQASSYWPRTPRKNLYSMSFAMHPDAWFPSGSVNMSRIDTVTMKYTLKGQNNAAVPAAYGSGNAHFYAICFNILRIQGGMGAKNTVVLVFKA